MTSSESYKILTLMIAMKRHRRNSVVFKGAYYKLAPKFGLSAQTFKKYILQAVELGFARDEGDKYVLIKFDWIVRMMHDESKLYFGQHNILKGNQTSFKEVLSEVHECYIIDNIMRRQQKQISKKIKDLSKLEFLDSETVKSYSNPRLSKSEYKSLKLLSRGGPIERASEKETIKKKLNQFVVTSSRHTAGKLGFSKSKANKLLSGMKKVRREIVVKWIKGATFYNLEKAKALHPKCTVYALPSIDRIKVCFGSTLTYRKE